jgi:hypothetical protein
MEPQEDRVFELFNTDISETGSTVELEITREERENAGFERPADDTIQRTARGFPVQSFNLEHLPIIVPGSAKNAHGDDYTVWTVSGINGPKTDIPIPSNVESLYANQRVLEGDCIYFVESVLRECQITAIEDVKQAVLWILAAPVLYIGSKPFQYNKFKPERYGILCHLADAVVPETHQTTYLLGVGISVPKRQK